MADNGVGESSSIRAATTPFPNPKQVSATGQANTLNINPTEVDRATYKASRRERDRLAFMILGKSVV
jgi:hypothetical protein